MPMTIETPCGFDEDFLDDCPYAPDVLFFDELSSVDRVKSSIRCRMPTDRPMPFTSSQRAHPTRHPRHVAGAVIIHATGSLGFIHAYFVLGLRHRDGWVGYGTHIHRGVFRRLVTPGTPIDATCTATRIRNGKTRIMARYDFEFRHEGAICYEGDQTAVWIKTDEDPPTALGLSRAGA